MGVFSKNNAPETDLKRNAFDGSFQNNLTMKMGYLYPCICKEVVPGDTFRINAAFGLRFMPTAFPLQTKIKAHIDFFYVRNRNLWDKWNNYYTQVGPHDGFPILSEDEAYDQFVTGSLGDYLGLPSTIVGQDNTLLTLYPFVNDSRSLPFNYTISTQQPNGTKLIIENINNQHPEDTYIVSLLDKRCFVDYTSVYAPFTTDTDFKPISDVVTDEAGVKYYKLFSANNPLSSLITNRGNKRLYVHVAVINSTSSDYSGNLFDASTYLMRHEFNDGVYMCLSERALTSNSKCLISLIYLEKDVKTKMYTALPLNIDTLVVNNPNFKTTFYTVLNFPITNLATNYGYNVVEATTYLSKIPLSISALPFRAYEQIYNSFYRDDRNNPYIVNGVFDPNVFLPTLSGGIDNNHYFLRKRNWEQDFLTTALTSPQFGNAPLVGLTSSGVAQFSDSDGNIITSQLTTDNDGDTVIGFSTTNNSSVNNTLIKLASSGISINDLRGVNALQRYLEAKMRRGLRYRDQMKSIFGIDIKQEILDMPEFIGSITQQVEVSQINQTSATGQDPLGSYAGQLSCIGGRRDGFQKYCDEQGYIIGIISVVPVPTYSQLLPKHFLKVNESLDFFKPQFNHLGYQPIKYTEVCPLQCLINDQPLEQTFGYQRAWYDYLSNTDEIHGDFRTTLNSFILARTFNNIPSLSPDFLTVDPESMNNVFTVSEVNGKPIDTILGQIHFDITMMRPISRFGVPSLE